MSLAKSLPRVREFNTKPPTVYDWNLVAQKVNRLADNEGTGGTSTSTTTIVNAPTGGVDGQIVQVGTDGTLVIGWGRMKTIS
jgi:hypothetical protein